MEDLNGDNTPRGTRGPGPGDGEVSDPALEQRMKDRLEEFCGPLGLPHLL